VSLSPKDPYEAIRLHLAELEARPLAKAKADPRDESRSSVHAAFVSAIDGLEELGWSRGRIARHIGCDLSTLGDWIERGDQRRSQLPFWVLHRLPIEARTVVLREVLAWSEPPPASKTGTDNG
jgi:hypothetical protein